MVSVWLLVVLSGKSGARMFKESGFELFEGRGIVDVLSEFFQVRIVVSTSMCMVSVNDPVLVMVKGRLIVSPGENFKVYCCDVRKRSYRPCVMDIFVFVLQRVSSAV